MAYTFQAYPSHRFHPSLDENEFVQVEDETEDIELQDSDPQWRDVPYSDEDRAEWKAKNSKTKKAKNVVKLPAKDEGKKAKTK